MFIQVVQGRAVNPVALRAQWQLWERELKPNAIGFLGATGGITEDGRFVAMVRFESGSAARTNATRVEQHVWWLETVKHLDGVCVQDSTRTDTWNKGFSAEAGFVQIRQGISRDPDRLRDLYVNQQPVRMGPFRPEVLGGEFAWHGSTGFTLSAGFTSEDAARRGERLDEFRSFFADIDAVMDDVSYFDLRDPWLSTGSAPEAESPQASMPSCASSAMARRSISSTMGRTSSTDLPAGSVRSQSR